MVLAVALVRGWADGLGSEGGGCRRVAGLDPGNAAVARWLARGSGCAAWAAGRDEVGRGGAGTVVFRPELRGGRGRRERGERERERAKSKDMGFDQDKVNTPLKLSLFSLPSQSPEPSGMLTPPLRTSASVPFHWEEAPGKPRSSVDGTKAPKAARTLGLPPRLAKITQTHSPTTVLDGPEELPRGIEGSFGGKGHVEDEKRGFGSWRWESVKEKSGEWRGIFNFSYSAGRRSRSESDFSKARIARVRKRSFFGSSKSHTWASFYESVKQAVRWRRKQ